MSNPAPRILIGAGPRVGHAQLANDDEFKAKIADGFEVFTLIRGVYFAVTAEGDGLRYTSLAERPDGI